MLTLRADTGEAVAEAAAEWTGDGAGVPACKPAATWESALRSAPAVWKRALASFATDIRITSLSSLRQPRIDGDRRDGSALQVRRHDGELAVAIERPLAGHQFIERDAHRVEVRTRIRRGDALDLLGRHVVQRARPWFRSA